MRSKVGDGDKMADSRRQSKRHRDGFMGPEGHSANLEACRTFLRGSWRLSTPSLTDKGLTIKRTEETLLHNLNFPNL